jgi:peptide deformylase
MALLKVARMGHPILAKRARPLTKAELASVAIQSLIDDMIETMFDERGVGLAGPQVHEPLRLFVMNEKGDEDEADTIVVVNPELTFPNEETQSLWEGCLSIPGIRGETSRRRVVDVAYLDRGGKKRRASLEDFPAAIVQHETDHLDGVLFVERMPDLKRLAFEDEYSRYHRM